MYARVLFVICVFLVAGTAAESRRWFSSEVGCWITQEKVPALWEDAQRRCERDDAVLASPLNMQLFNYMQSLINVQNHSSAYFIGTRTNRSDYGQEVYYVSVEGRRLAEMPRAVFDAIDQLDLEQGDCLSMDRHGIHAVSCWEHLPYICYSNETKECGSVLATTQTPFTSESTKNASVPTTNTAASTTITTARQTFSRVQQGYTYYPSTRSYYKFHGSLVSWDEANTTCVREGAHVVVLNDAEEAVIVALIVNDAGYYDTWTGLRDNGSGGVMEWRTVHGEPLSDVYNVWYDGRPSNIAGRTCAYFYSDTNTKRLRDYRCEWSNYFICEISQS